MFESFKKNIAYFLINRKYRNNKEPLSFSNIYSGSTEFLAIVKPFSENQKPLAKLFEEFIRDGKKITVFTADELVEFFSAKNKISFLQYSGEEITKLGLPRRSLVERIKQDKFDIIIDLDFNESLLNYAVSNLCKAKYSIGFKKEKSDRFYNFQVPVTERNYEISYRNLLNSLRMF